MILKITNAGPKNKQTQYVTHMRLTQEVTSRDNPDSFTIDALKSTGGSPDRLPKLRIDQHTSIKW